MAKDHRDITARNEVEKGFKKLIINSNTGEENLDEKKKDFPKTYSDIQEEQLNK